MNPSQIVSLWTAWLHMKSRCYNPENKSFVNYGGRGIRMCERWLESFDTFCEDMGPKPFEGATIDRINNDGNYEPGNVRWASSAEQAANRRSTRLMTHKGRTMCLKAWAAEAGLSQYTVSQRLRYGWPLERALSEKAMPRAKSDPGTRLLTANGKTQHLAAWARELDCNPAAILARLNLGWDVERALTEPPAKRPNAKLTMRQARAIRASAESSTKLAARYGVSKKTVLNVRHDRVFRE